MAQDPYKLDTLPDWSLGGSLPDGSLPDFESEAPAVEYIPRKRLYSKPEKIAPKQKEAETLGFLTNLPKSVLKMAKEIFVDLPVAVGTSAYHYAKDPSQYLKDVNLFLDKPGDAGEMLRKGITDYYADGNFWANFNEDPARLLSDAATVMSGVGALGKAGNLGRAANIAKAGKAGLLSPAARTAAKVGRIGQIATEAADYVDPLMLAGKGAKRLLQGGLEAIGYGKYTSDIERFSSHLAAREAMEEATATKKNLFDKLDPAQKEELLELLMVGDPGYIEAAAAKGGPLAKRLMNWDERINQTEQPFWKATGSLDDDAMIKANAKGVAAYTRSESWKSRNLPEMDAATAERLIRAGKLKPTYMSLYRLKNQSLDLFDALNQPAGRRPAQLGRLEKRLATGEYLRDPDEIMSRQIHSFHQAKYKLNLLDTVKQFLLEKGEVLIAHTPEDIASAVQQGYRPLRDAFYAKYWSSFNKATAAQVKVLVDAARKGLNQRDAVLKLRDLFNRSQIDDWTKAAVNDTGQLFVPAHVAAWLDKELAPVSAGWQMYDRWMSRFKSTATVFNPRYWAPVVFGNALLATLYGLSPDMLKIALKYRGDLPPSLKSLMQHEIYLNDLGIYDRTARKLGEAASMLDNFYKQGIFAQEITKDSYARLKFGINTFFPAKATLEEAVRYFSAAPESHVRTLTELAQLRNQVAGDLTVRDKELRRLKRLEDRHTKELAHLTQLKQTTLLELSQGLDARADIIGKTFSDISIHPKYSYFVQRLLDEIKGIKAVAKNAPLQMDNASILTALDSAIHSVAAGHPEWLRHSLRQLQKAKSARTPLMHRRDRLSVLTNMLGAAENRVLERTTEMMNRLAKSGQLSKQLPQLARDADVANRAIEVGHRFFGSYHSLLPFEKRVIRRIIPFYTFTKAMTSLAFRFPFLYPKRSFMMIHLARAWNDVMQDENSFMPSWTKNYIPVAGMKDGSVVMIRAGSLGPMSNVRFGRIGDMPIPSILDVTQQHPVMRLIFEMKGGIPEWSAKPLSPGDNAVRMDNGEVIEWTGTGFKKTVAQPNILKSIVYLFPQAQLIDSVLHRYAQTDRGWLFSPKPIAGPDGKARYPKELRDALLSLIVPTTTVDQGRIAKQEKLKVALTVKEYAREIRTATPDRRSELIESLKEWSRSRKTAME